MLRFDFFKILINLTLVQPTHPSIFRKQKSQDRASSSASYSSPPLTVHVLSNRVYIGYMMDILASLNMLNVLSAFPFANTKWTRIDTAVASTEIELFIYTRRKLCHLHCSTPPTCLLYTSPSPRDS